MSSLRLLPSLTTATSIPRSVAAASATLAASFTFILSSLTAGQTAAKTTITTKTSGVAAKTTSTVTTPTAPAVPETIAEQLKDLEAQIAALIKSFIKKPTAAVAAKIKALQIELAEIIVQQWFWVFEGCWAGEEYVLSSMLFSIHPAFLRDRVLRRPFEKHLSYYNYINASLKYKYL